MWVKLLFLPLIPSLYLVTSFNLEKRSKVLVKLNSHVHDSDSWFHLLITTCSIYHSTITTVIMHRCFEVWWHMLFHWAFWNGTVGWDSRQLVVGNIRKKMFMGGVQESWCLISCQASLDFHFCLPAAARLNYSRYSGWTPYKHNFWKHHSRSAIQNIKIISAEVNLQNPSAWDTTCYTTETTVKYFPPGWQILL